MLGERIDKGTNRPREFPEYETDRDQLVRIEVPIEIRRPCSCGSCGRMIGDGEVEWHKYY